MNATIPVVVYRFGDRVWRLGGQRIKLWRRHGRGRGMGGGADRVDVVEEGVDGLDVGRLAGRVDGVVVITKVHALQVRHRRRDLVLKVCIEWRVELTSLVDLVTRVTFSDFHTVCNNIFYQISVGGFFLLGQHGSCTIAATVRGSFTKHSSSTKLFQQPDASSCRNQ